MPTSDQFGKTIKLLLEKEGGDDALLALLEKVPLAQLHKEEIEQRKMLDEVVKVLEADSSTTNTHEQQDQKQDVESVQLTSALVSPRLTTFVAQGHKSCFFRVDKGPFTTLFYSCAV